VNIGVVFIGRNEDFSLPPMECMAFRNPVVSSKVVEPLNLIRIDVNGELGEFDDVAGIRTSFTQGLHSPELMVSKS
jgi:hypothetical protein